MGAKGLMQIIPKYHQAKLVALGGEAALWDPEANIRLGAPILQEYVYAHRHAGSGPAVLQRRLRRRPRALRAEGARRARAADAK